MMMIFDLLWSLCLVLLVSNRACSLPSCDEPQVISITRGQKISVVYWLGQNHPADESVLELSVTEPNSSDNVTVSFDVDDSSSSQVTLDDNLTTTDSSNKTIVSSASGYDLEISANETLVGRTAEQNTTVDVVQLQSEQEKVEEFRLDGAVAVSSTQSSLEGNETSVFVLGERDGETEATIDTDDAADVAANETLVGCTDEQNTTVDVVQLRSEQEEEEEKEERKLGVDVAVSSTQTSLERNETAVGIRGEREGKTEATIGTNDAAKVSSSTSHASLADDSPTESWGIIFTDSPIDPDILVDPRDPETTNGSDSTLEMDVTENFNDSTVNSSLPPQVTDVASLVVRETEVGRKVDAGSLLSTVGSPNKERHQRNGTDPLFHNTKPFFLERAPTVPSSSSPGPSPIEVVTPLANIDGHSSSSVTINSTLSAEIPSLLPLQESPVHYLTVLRSPDGTLPIRSLNRSASSKQFKSQQLVRNTRSINITLCKWVFKSDPGVPLLLTFKTFSTPETSDCKDHYIAVERESNGFQSRWCGVSGDRPGHASFTRSEISLYLSSNGDGSFPTGFSVEVQALDLKLLRKYAEVRRIIKSQ